jgi:hypothetical protein
VNRAQVAHARTRRLPGVVNLIAALVLVALVLTIALRTERSQPPAVAEFAPQSHHPITQAPAELSSRCGGGPGGEASGSGAIGPSPTPSPAALPSGAVLLHCVGDPPRQIEDPQAPPCVPYWVGDNGGATYHGVTPDQVRIVAPCTTQNGANSVLEQDFTNFFNRRFEFYKRQILLDCENLALASDAPTNRSEAETAWSNNDFGSMYTNAAEGGVYYYDALAQKQLVATAAADDFLTRDWLQAHDPYVTSYEMAADGLLANLGEFACAWLAG